MKLFSMERNHCMVFRFNFEFRIVLFLIDMLDIKNSIWQLIRTRNLSYVMSIVDSTVNIS